ncbi:Wzz/FepE/Etk N-terminal domain-containing protein [Roseateles sp. BYS87W]|uniref:Wzz/FepE/Etk N-terminal domain-containing protein n=1 Tax=Pelomonas baiyunensis TaxID=3299026 RepID=A0ABW7H3B5_9BURK
MSTLPNSGAAVAAESAITLSDYAAALRARWVAVTAVPLAAAALALGASYLVTPTFTARTSFMPPQQQQGSAAGAIASLGALAGLSGSVRNTGDQFVTFVQSRTVADGLLQRFDLKTVYDEKLAHDVRLKLADRTRVSIGKKDGVITLEVDDESPQRAADMANAYVEEVRKLTAGLTLTEAQQRRAFFEGQLKQVRAKLDSAQAALQGTGVSTESIKAEPKAAVEALAKLRAELTNAEVRLQMLSSSLSSNTPEVQQQTAAVSRLRAELNRAGQAERSAPGGYVGAYREFKYQETLFDLIARQYELARVDESRDGGQLQVIDVAQVPERKSKPKRSFFMIAGFALGLLLMGLQTGRELKARREQRAA